MSILTKAVAALFAALFTLSAAQAASPENILVIDLKGDKSAVVEIELLPNLAPGHVERIKTLARKKFYDGIVFHRVIADFMAQTGDPQGTGSGGSDLPDLKAEFTSYPFKRGPLVPRVPPTPTVPTVSSSSVTMTPAALT